MLLVTHGKTAAARRVLPMTPRVREVLETRWERAGKPLEGWVWPAQTRSGHLEGSSIKKQHAKALRASKVRPFVLYSLRHTFLTRLGESGCDAWTLARIAGHSSVSMSTRYVHPSEAAVFTALEKLGWHKIGHNGESGETTQGARKLLPSWIYRRKWSGRKDLNLRPPGPEPGALARLRYAPTKSERPRTPIRHEERKNNTERDSRQRPFMVLAKAVVAIRKAGEALRPW